MLTFGCHLYHKHRFGDFGSRYGEKLRKTLKKIIFSKIYQKTMLNNVMVAVFVVIMCGTLTSSFFVDFSSNWHILIFYSLLCMRLQTSILGLYLLSNMAAENNGKPGKIKIWENRKTKRWLLLIWIPWWRIWTYLGCLLRNLP